MFKEYTPTMHNFFKNMGQNVLQGLYTNRKIVSLAILLAVIGTCYASFTEGLTLEEICAELNGYRELCDLKDVKYLDFEKLTTLFMADGSNLGDTKGSAPEVACDLYDRYA